MNLRLRGSNKRLCSSPAPPKKNLNGKKKRVGKEIMVGAPSQLGAVLVTAAPALLEVRCDCVCVIAYTHTTDVRRRAAQVSQHFSSFPLYGGRRVALEK